MTLPSAEETTAWVILSPTDEYPGWYAYIEDYPDDGSVGPFDTREELDAWLRDNQ